MTSRRTAAPLFTTIAESILSFSLYNWSLPRFLSLIVPAPLRRFVSQTLASIFAMDGPSLFFSDADDSFDLFGSSSRDDVAQEKLYFVPYRWWDEVWEALFVDSSEVKGIFYAADSRITPVDSGGYDVVSEIVLNMSKQDGCGKRNRTEEGDCALIAEWMFLRALKWHNDVNDVRGLSSMEVNMPDIFPLLVKLSVSQCSSSLIVRISQKDNEVAVFTKACDIFHVETGAWGLWDFSGQTAQFLARGRIMLSDNLFDTDEEIPLELQVYGSNYLRKRGERRRDQTKSEHSLAGGSFNSLMLNGMSDRVSSNFRLDKSLPSGSCYLEAGNLGLTGLRNLGNTCFLNSAIQCLVHTPNLVDYFLGDYKNDINTENPLGMNGELALQFGDLLRKLWTPASIPVAPTAFKSKLAAFAPQFGGFNQHDSQEFLAFLLDGLHEDLNRVKVKPYIEAKDADDRPDDEVTEEYWRNHLARNDSIIVDLCQGQFRSTLVCPICKKSSITFDPFMYLSLPLPSTTMRVMTLTVFSTDGTTLPYPVTITVPKFGHCKDLVQAISTACLLKDDETLLIAEIFNNRIIQYLDNPNDSLDLLRDDDRLVAYRLPKGSDRSCLVEFMHERTDRQQIETSFVSPKRFGIPIVASIDDLSAGSEILKVFLRLLNPFLMPVEDFRNDDDDNYDQADADKITIMEDITCTNLPEGDLNSMPSFEFSLVEARVYVSNGDKIKMNEPLGVPPSKKIYVIVSWPVEMIDLYDTCLLSNLPPINKPGILSRKDVSLYKCLEAFLKEEPLGPEDMWFCPNCKEHQQASKKLDIWRLPEILIIHLKRFSYNRYFKNKLETFVDFPIDDLDLSSYIPHKDSAVSQCYKLYAVSNHYGSLGGGHYTAFAQHGSRGWYEFDDSHISVVIEDNIKTSAAYVLFYRRK